MRSAITIVLLLGLLSPNIQASEKVAESKIADVVVFLDGAQISRTAEVQIPEGETEILFKGLTSKLTPSSLQVSSEKNVSILSVNHKLDHMGHPQITSQIRELRDQRNALEDSIEIVKNRQSVLKGEQEMLLKNQSVGGSQSGIQTEQLRDLLDFFKNRMTDIKQDLLKLKKQLSPMAKRLENLNKQLDELNDRKDSPTSTISVRVEAENPTHASFQVNYTVDQAYWEPSYNLRVKDINHPLDLHYKAKVYQTTGIAWDHVNLSLSTGDPSINQEKPELDPWIIRPKPKKSAIRDTEKARKLTKGPAVQLEAERPAETSPSVSPDIQQTTTIFRVNQPFTIPSDGQEHDVPLLQHQIDAEYEYATVPRRSSHAFLMAKFSDWDDLNLLPGEAGIYFNQTFQGNTHIDPYVANDTLSLSIGRDPGIVVTREAKKDYSSNTFFGNNQKKTKAWKISVRNNKNTAVDIWVEDQIPVSGDSDIKVKLEESSGARVNKETGLLKWPLTLDAGETRELNLVYSVQYPRDTQVILE